MKKYFIMMAVMIFVLSHFNVVLADDNSDYNFSKQLLPQSDRVITNFNGQGVQMLGIEGGYFSGNQRAAMMFGNQIEDAADSLSVPGKKEGNKYVNPTLEQLMAMSEKELFEVLGNQVSELEKSSGYSYEPKSIAGENFSYDSKLYYVLIPRTHLKNFVNNCEAAGAVPVICNPSQEIEKMGKAGVVVEPKGSKMIIDVIKNYNGRPLDKVVLYAIVLCNDLKTKPVKTILVGDKLEGDFKKCSGILNKMTKNPFGQRASMFRNIAKYYPGMLEKLPVTDVESNGRIYKQFEFPVVHLVLGALDMNGKGKHVILSHEQFIYTLVKYLPKQIRK